MKMDGELEQSELKNLTRKHITERHRRARINSYLEEIQDLTHTDRSSEGQRVKLEKAEVLETALVYLQNNQNIEQNNNTVTSREDLDIQAYEDGYRSCMNTILRGFDEAGLLQDIVPDLKTHLESSLEKTLSTSTSVQAETDTEHMAFSPSLAKLEQYLQKFEDGNAGESDAFQRKDTQMDDDDKSDVIFCTLRTDTTIPNKQDALDTCIQTMDLFTSGVNEWVNRQREYVMYQNTVFQRQQNYQNLVQNQNQNKHQLPVDYTVSRSGKSSECATKVTDCTEEQNRETNRQNTNVSVWRPW